MSNNIEFQRFSTCSADKAGRVYTNYQSMLSREQHALCDGKNESCEFIQVRINKSKSWQEDVIAFYKHFFFYFLKIRFHPKNLIACYWNKRFHYERIKWTVNICEHRSMYSFFDYRRLIHLICDVTFLIYCLSPFAKSIFNRSWVKPLNRPE
jgi:hypothetical protein